MILVARRAYVALRVYESRRSAGAVVAHDLELEPRCRLVVADDLDEVRLFLVAKIETIAREHPVPAPSPVTAMTTRGNAKKSGAATVRCSERPSGISTGLTHCARRAARVASTLRTNASKGNGTPSAATKSNSERPTGGNDGPGTAGSIAHEGTSRGAGGRQRNRAERDDHRNEPFHHEAFPRVTSSR